MKEVYVIDTHALIWFLTGDARLGAEARRVLSLPGADLILPVIALSEACWLVERGRSSIPGVQELLNEIDADARIVVTAFTRQMLEVSLRLTVIDELHDRLIVAAGVVLESPETEVRLITKDANITGSGTIATVWS